MKSATLIKKRGSGIKGGRQEMSTSGTDTSTTAAPDPEGEKNAVRRALKQQKREWIRVGREVARRAEEERTIYLVLCVLSALAAVVGGHLCGYYMGKLEADHQHRQQLSSLVNQQLPSVANATSTIISSSWLSSLFSVFSSSHSPAIAAVPPAAATASSSLLSSLIVSAEEGHTQLLVRVSSSVGGGLIAFVGLLCLYHFALKMVRL